MHHCRESDVLVFPSLSDGFGMAQLEAQRWRLPVIASPFCGRVVRDGVNGILLPEVSPETIAAALRTVASRPELLAEFSRNSSPERQPGVSGLASDLLRLELV
jgi:glycosyltransferase involved in cell wall biosynthesis